MVHSHSNERRTFWAMLLTGGFMLAELVGGLVAGSLALLADAAHMLADTVSLALAWLAFRLSRRPADGRRTYGFHRVQVLAAFTNGLILIALAGWITVEAVSRFLAPQQVLAAPMLGIAALGLIVNLVVFAILHGADRDNLNVAGAMAHVLGDLLGSVAAIAAALIILTTGWMPIDPLLSLLIAGIILVSGARIVRRAGHILLEGTPGGIDPEALRADLLAHAPAVVELHHLHLWSLTQEKPLITLHARLAAGAAPDTAMQQLKSRLRDHYGLDHSTLQLEAGPCPDGPDPATEGLQPPAEHATSDP